MKIDTAWIKTNLQKAWDDSPALCLTAGATAMTAVVQLVKVNNERRNAATYRKEVNRRVKKDTRR